MKHEPYENRGDVLYISDDEPKQRKCCGGLGFVVALVLIGVFAALAIPLLRSNCCKNRAAYRFEQRQTWFTLESASESIERYRLEHEGKLPEGVAGNRLVIEFTDAWGKTLRYEDDGDSYVVRSAGSDGEFNSKDDLATRIHVSDSQATSSGAEIDSFDDR
ncbi:MAG: hypothetical protein IH991_09745 [Planctomycetes bacterium]|nr:hypothetical protein [Planctomycetota bacterium]